MSKNEELFKKMLDAIGYSALLFPAGVTRVSDVGADTSFDSCEVSGEKPLRC